MQLNCPSLPTSGLYSFTVDRSFSNGSDHTARYHEVMPHLVVGRFAESEFDQQ